MGKASRSKQDPDRRARVAAQRAAARRAERRRRLYLASGAIVVVIVVVVGFIIFKGSGGGSSADSASNGPTGAALTSVVSQATSVPTATLDKVGSGSGQVSAKPSTISGSLLTSGGKPEMLYVGAEYCPYCAAERWAMVVALSRFGTFSGLATVHSAAKDGQGTAEPYPNTPTWTFAHATYTSQYLTFTPVEQYTNIPDSSTGGYTTLQNITSAQQSLITKYDSANQGAIPFIDFGNKYLISGASYNPQVLDGHSWAQVAAALKNPSSQIAQGVDGTANYITAAICKITNNQPTSACTTVVKSLESQI
jgi:uncharacterized protein DUF929